MKTKFPDIEVRFELNDVRHVPAPSGYRPAHRVREDYLASGVHEYYDTDRLYPNAAARGSITFLSPEAYPPCLGIGKRIDIQEGARIVGWATMLKIWNPLLEAPVKE